MLIKIYDTFKRLKQQLEYKYFPDFLEPNFAFVAPPLKWVLAALKNFPYYPFNYNSSGNNLNPKFGHKKMMFVTNWK